LNATGLANSLAKAGNRGSLLLRLQEKQAGLDDESEDATGKNGIMDMWSCIFVRCEFVREKFVKVCFFVCE
jgi:hypothetical protein